MQAIGFEEGGKPVVKYHGRGGPWLRRGLGREASGTAGGEFNSARARPREGLAWNR